jgi:plastocyanin
VPASPKPSARAGATVQITISGIEFATVKQPLAVGDVVEWINKDVVAHTATATNKDWRVVIPENGTATLILKKPGTVDYYCEYHPNMTGRLVIGDK